MIVAIHLSPVRRELVERATGFGSGQRLVRGKIQWACPGSDPS